MINTTATPTISANAASAIVGHSTAHAAPPGVPGNLVFSDTEAVRAVHRALAQAPALSALCDRVFDSADLAGTRDAVATLMLYKCADERHQSSVATAQSRADALATLAAHLSPAGEHELQQALDANTGHSAFAPYLADVDRLGLAAQMWLTQGEADYAAGAFESAFSAWTTAADTWLLANKPERAAVAFQRVAAAYQEASQWAQAADVYTAAAVAYAVAQLPQEASQAYTMAGDAYVQAGRPEYAVEAYMQAGYPARAAGVYNTIAQSHCLNGQHEHAARAFDNAARVCWAGAQGHAYWGRTEQASAFYTRSAEFSVLAAGSYDRADPTGERADLADAEAQAHMRAGDAYTGAGKHALAAYAYERAAEKRKWADAPEPVAKAYEMAAAAYLAAKKHDEAAEAYLAAAHVYAQGDVHANAVQAYLRAADAYWQAPYPSYAEAAQACALAARGYTRIGQHELAGDTYVNARLYRHAVEAYDRAIEDDRAAGRVPSPDVLRKREGARVLAQGGEARPAGNYGTSAFDYFG